ncbi:MAG: alanine--tRNA ligase-related protein [Candidatus Sumerlaeaceae bacterium]
MLDSQQLYYEEPYSTELKSEVLAVELGGGNNAAVELEKTIFYPEGGGQPSDQGEIVGAHGTLKVEQVQNKGGRILHQGKLLGKMAPGEEVHLSLKWSHRHHNMRVHTAGHLVHDILMQITDQLTPKKGSHGKKAFLEYRGKFDPSRKDELQQHVNDAVTANLPVKMSESSFEEISATCRFVPPGLPTGKPLRTLQIGEFGPMPDGGVHVRGTAEIGQVIIQEILPTDEGTIVKYRVSGGD